LLNAYVAATSYIATLPTTGATIYVRLYSVINGKATLYYDYSYTEFPITLAVMTALQTGAR